jgi:hypothetical protein
MVPYTEAAAFTDRVRRLEAEIRCFVEERQRLGGIKRRERAAEEQRLFQNLQSTIKTRQTKLRKVLNLDALPWDLLHFLMDAEGTLWTPDEVDMWHKDLATNEGRGERALRLRHGLPGEATMGSCDLVKWVDDDLVLYEEVKNLQGRRGDGKFQLQDIQTGKAGRQVFGMWVLHEAEAGAFKHLEGLGSGRPGRSTTRSPRSGTACWPGSRRPTSWAPTKPSTALRGTASSGCREPTATWPGAWSASPRAHPSTCCGRTTWCHACGRRCRLNLT